MDQQSSSNAAAGLMAGGFMLVAVIIGLAVTVFLIWLFWRIFTKAGMAGPLALLLLFPGIGWLICLCILAFGTWRVVPAPVNYVAGLPQNYPPQAPLPPGSYPPQNKYPSQY